MGGKALLVSAATMSSRLLGLVREQLFAALLGATAFADAFVVAFRIPNLLRDLFAEGALSAAFVPTFADRYEKQGRDAAFRLANVVIGALLIVVGALTLLGIVFSPELVAFMAPGFAETPGKQELTALCTRLMFPFLPLVSLAAVAMGQLNARERYGAPAFSSALFNVVAILGGLLLLVLGVREEAAVIGWSLATLLGGAAQLFVQVPALYREGFRFRPALDFADEGLRRIVRLMGPATVGLAATQINIFVNTLFASQVPGAPAWLNYAFRMMQLPIGVFGVAVATIATTGVAKSAAEGDLGKLRATVTQGLELVAFFTIPSTAGLIVLRDPIVRLLFEHGRFHAQDTQATAAAILMYATGLYAYAAVKVLAPAFYALDRARLPLVASVLAVVTNVILNIVLFPVLSFEGLALGTAAGATINFAVLLFALRAGGALPFGALVAHVVRILLASAPCAFAALVTVRALEARLGTEAIGARMLAVGAAVAAGAVAYALACKLLRVDELEALLERVRRRTRY